ncbi:U3 small nucleolar RNA-associated protein 6 homolog isoform X2 [Metopolophium dirhodum]|uniref:U3 small nucleolar RNA-associated protein 6 homolog isoform X2 n=1 Tax=Metopolophium dirhodum TaxID=44670 RepID=UPI0029906A74|nr:U3 small nucleolar RNA-associated protein 6 homolog isoform X2 [Metopolophium dirhodum]
MAESVQRRKENFINGELPLLNSVFNDDHVGYIVYQRQSHEHRVTRRNRSKSDFINFINFLKSVIKEVKKMNPDSNTFKLINLHNNKIILLYRAALKYFNYDLSVWTKYIQFLMKHKNPTMVQKVIDRTLLLHGKISDSLYIYAIEIEIGFLRNIQKAREMYTSGLQLHKYSSNLYFEAFNCELTNSKMLIQEVLKSGKELDSYDPALDVSLAKVIFESAVQNVKEDTDLFFQMYHAAIQYHFSLDLSKEIKKKCLSRYNAALSIVDTDEMWDKYLITMIKILYDAGLTEINKIDLIKESLHCAHKKNKLKPNHYIHLIFNSKGSMPLDILDWAVEAYPNDIRILEVHIQFKLTNKDELVAYELFKENANEVSPTMWLIIIKYFSNKPQIWHIFNIAFGDESLCSNKVKKKIANEYLLWLSKNKSLNDARNAYLLLNTNNSCDASLCKTMVTLETGQQIIDVSRIRQHFTLACMQFGKTDIDLWMERIYFELNYGSLKLVITTYHQALKTLNNEESHKFAELLKEYSTLNSICNP